MLEYKLFTSLKFHLHDRNIKSIRQNNKTHPSTKFVPPQPLLIN